MLLIDVVIYFILIYAIEKKWIKYLTWFYDTLAKYCSPQKKRHRKPIDNDVLNEQKIVNYWMAYEPVYGRQLLCKVFSYMVGTCLGYIGSALRSECIQRTPKPKKDKAKKVEKPKKEKKETKKNKEKEIVVQVVGKIKQKTPCTYFFDIFLILALVSTN